MKGGSLPPPPSGVAISPIGGITGWMSWPDDPIYRPVVGLFVDGLLRATAPTFRNRQLSNGEAIFTPKGSRRAASDVSGSSWVCAFDFRVDSSTSGVGS